MYPKIGSVDCLIFFSNTTYNYISALVLISYAQVVVLMTPPPVLVLLCPGGVPMTGPVPPPVLVLLCPGGVLMTGRYLLQYWYYYAQVVYL